MSDYTYLHDVTAPDGELSRLETLIGSVDRPGDYCAHGRLVSPMPRIVVDGMGTLSLPVPGTQMEELVAASDPAPYGRGTDTIVDPGVRNCRQVEAGLVEVSGRAWNDTFSSLLDRSAEGLGCPREMLDAELYKLLVYETGGFFVPHRDTEKAEGMVATLVIALPVVGRGGELVVRHRGREEIVDMAADDPSEFSWAAFYADCEHEIRPVTEGNRICLVYNLMLKDGGAPLRAPDHDDLVAPIAEELAALPGPSRRDRKLVWLLEHDYSEAGLSFGTLKNTDRAVGRVLAAAAERAGYFLHTAILQLEDTFHVGFHGYGYVREVEVVPGDEIETYEAIDTSCTLGCWTTPDGKRVDYGELPLVEGELMPDGRLDPGVPDMQRLTEATGNAGATLDRLYRRAALVLWPEPDTVAVLGAAGTGAILAYLAGRRGSADGPERAGFRELADRAAGIWPVSRYPFPGWHEDTAQMLEILCADGGAEALSMFVRERIMPHFQGEFNETLTRAGMRLGPEEMREMLVALAREKLPDHAEGTVDLAHRLCREGLARDWEEPLRDMVHVICTGMPSVNRSRRRQGWSGEVTDPLPGAALEQLFHLAWRLGLEEEIREVADFFIGLPDLVPPDRTIPALLRNLHAGEQRGRAVGNGFADLWRHSAEALLSRSGVPPSHPLGWALPVDRLDCGCGHCIELRKFCEHPTATMHRFKARQDARSHIEGQIRSAGLDMDCDTEESGRPYVLICTKNRASWERRLREYREDIGQMKILEGIAIAVPESGPSEEALRAAIGRASESRVSARRDG